MTAFNLTAGSVRAQEQRSSIRHQLSDPPYHRDWPPNRDISTYAVIGHEMAAWRALYSDLFDNKPPAIYWSYMATEQVFGYGETAVRRIGDSSYRTRVR